MAAIKDRDTKPELLIRRRLHSCGLRFRLHDRKLPGRPDLVFPKYRAVLLVNGCFWHGHDCPLFRWPKTRPEFWREKISGNVHRDISNEIALAELGWRIGIVWECSVKGPKRLPLENLTDIIAGFLTGKTKNLWIQGQQMKIKPSVFPLNDENAGCAGLLRSASGFI
jgi:DNA mismatch endonuclease (patch repair protein)